MISLLFNHVHFIYFKSPSLRVCVICVFLFCKWAHAHNWFASQKQNQNKIINKKKKERKKKRRCGRIDLHSASQASFIILLLLLLLQTVRVDHSAFTIIIIYVSRNLRAYIITLCYGLFVTARRTQAHSQSIVRTSHLRQPTWRGLYYIRLNAIIATISTINWYLSDPKTQHAVH